jgi:Ca2+-binding RTX toxin-like protein
MAAPSGSITIGGGSGSAIVVLSGNDYASSHASMFQSMMAQVVTSGSGFYAPSASATLFLVANNQGNIGLVGGVPSSTVVVGDGSTLSYFGSASATVIAGDGNDTVLAGGGSDTIALGGGSNTIYLGTGDSYVSSQGTDLIQAGGGVDTVDVSGTSSSIYGGYGGSLMVDDSAGINTTVFATAGTVVRGSDLSATTVDTYGDSTISGGQGGMTLNQENGRIIFFGTAGGDAVVNDNTEALPDTLYGASGSAIHFSGTVHNNVFAANQPGLGADGSVLFDGSQASGGNQFWAGAGNATLEGGTGQDTLVAGEGGVTMTGGNGGANTFDFFHANGGSAVHATITDFGAASGNVMTLFGYGGGGVLTALATATQVGSATTFSLNDGTSVTLADYSKASLTVHSFLFTNPAT